MKLYIFDADGTLVERDTGELLLNVVETIGELPEDTKIAIATNQGGVGLRYWMELMGFGNPEEYPTQQHVEDRYSALFHAGIPIYYAFRYQSKNSGTWSPVPPEGFADPRWSMDWRKPNPGMLLRAMEDAGVDAANTVMVGDSDEDRQAAAAAGVQFIHADEFFGR